MLDKIVVALYVHFYPSEHLSQYLYGVHSAFCACQFMKFYVVLEGLHDHANNRTH